MPTPHIEAKVGEIAPIVITAGDPKRCQYIANKYLNNWTIDRLGNTDKAILEMSIYELLYTETPDIVCINEGIELAKLYSDDSVRKMINAVLDNVYHNKEQ